MLIHVDRDSVAAGDDTESHDHTLNADPNETLGALVALLTPDASVTGPAAWAVRLTSGGQPGEYVAVHSAELGGMRVARHGQRTLGSFSEPSVGICYFETAPAELLLAEVEHGEGPDRFALRQEGRRRLRAGVMRRP